MREGCKGSGASEAWGSGGIGKILTGVGRHGGDDETDRGKKQPAEGVNRRGKHLL
jgi:hypothetical protein